MIFLESGGFRDRFSIMTQTRAYCSDCKAKRLFEKQGTNNILHLILSLVTAGGWLVVWLFCGLANAFKPFRCTVCGKGILK